MKLVYADILTCNFFVIQIIVKSRHHIDPKYIQKAPWNKWIIMWLSHISGHVQVSGETSDKQSHSQHLAVQT